jgi:hypothetical protein
MIRCISRKRCSTQFDFIGETAGYYGAFEVLIYSHDTVPGQSNVKDCCNAMHALQVELCTAGQNGCQTTFDKNLCLPHPKK